MLSLTGHRFNPEKAHKLHASERQKVLPAEAIVKRLGVGGDDRVADLGAGSGYFTIPAAKMTTGVVYAVDIEPKMLDMLKERAAEEKVENIQYVQSDLEHIPLPDGAVEKIIAAFVLHEVPNLERVLNEIGRLLKPGGQVLVLEWEAVEGKEGPPLAERIPSQQLVHTLNRHGFDTERSSLSRDYYAILTRSSVPC